MPNEHACGASPTSEKHAPGILEHVPCVFCRFLLFLFNFRYLFAGFRVSQQGASVWLPAALRRPQKKHAPGFLEHVSCMFCWLFNILNVFAGLRVSQQGASVWWLPAALFFLKKTRPWIFWACILLILWICLDFVDIFWFEGPVVKFEKYGPCAQMTMPVRCASKFCAMAPHLVSKLYFLSNSWK